MNAYVRLVLVWLMLLAIPFQGIASAAMLACAHDAPPKTVQTAAPPCHEMADSAHDGAHDSDTDHDERCSACAACCMGAAMTPPAPLAAAPQSIPARAAPAATGRIAAVDLALPERPPRPRLA